MAFWPEVKSRTSMAWPLGSNGLFTKPGLPGMRLAYGMSAAAGGGVEAGGVVTVGGVEVLGGVTTTGGGGVVGVVPVEAGGVVSMSGEVTAAFGSGFCTALGSAMFAPSK